MLDLRSQLDRTTGTSSRADARTEEFVDGWGIMSLPFASGDVLGLRVFPRGSFGAYRALWHRDPEGRWSILVDGVPAGNACPRYFGPACNHTGPATVEVTWVGPSSVTVTVPEIGLEWTAHARTTPALSLANLVARVLPASSWTVGWVLRARELMARAFGAGDLRLRASTPSGHTGRLVPEQMYFVDESTAVLGGRDLGHPVRLTENPVIGGFPLASRGVLVRGGAVFEALVPAQPALEDRS